MTDEQTLAAMSRKQGANRTNDVEVVPTCAALGAEIRGMDLSKPVSEGTKRRLRAAWATHKVLLWRNQHLSDQAFLETARIFGPIHQTTSRGARPPTSYVLHGKQVTIDPLIVIISNLDDAGQPVEHNWTLGSDEVLWHSDYSYDEVPPAGSTLFAVAIPSNGGGDTWFSNQELAYDELPEDLKALVAGKTQLHDASRDSAGVPRIAGDMPTRSEQVPGAIHPLVRIHPVTRRRSLYLGRRRDWPSSYILGLPNDESERLLDRLWEHATQARYTWCHSWQVGDLILWDNRCCMHYRSKVDVNQPRLLHRTMTQGEPVIPG